MSKTKKKKKDFQKVKFKVGKKLPKGQNVTNTCFKTRTIQVVQKLKGESSEPSTHRKLNIKELLSQCQHYNSGVRHEAVSGLKEIITLHPHLVPLHLSAMFEKISQLFTDKDSAVRQAVIRLLKIIFSFVSSSQLSPFFPLLSAHLCCAMTHIYEDIQKDSLNIFDLLLETYPDLVTNNSTQILPNFIEQISRNRVTGRSKGLGNRMDSGRSLTVMPNSRISVHKWRSGVLARLHKLLTAMLTLRAQNSKEDKKTESVIRWQPSSETKQIFPSYVINSWASPGFVLGSDRTLITGTSNKSGSSGDHEYNIKKYADILVPLLIECWMESRPTMDNNSSDSGSIVQQNVMSVMLTIASVIQLLWESLVAQREHCHDDSISSYLASFFKDFDKYFLSSFPYAVHETMHPPKKAKHDFPVVPVETLNLAICDIMSYFVGNSAVSVEMKWIAQICDYVTSCLKGRELDANQIRVVIRIIKKLMVETNSLGNDSQLLEESLQYYLSCHPLSTEKKLFLNLFSDQLLYHSQTVFVWPRNVMERFLKSLPELLSVVIKDNDEMSTVIMSVMKQAACKKCSTVFASLEGVFIDLLDPNTGSLVNCKSVIQNSLLEILYWFPTLKPSLLKSLCGFLLDDQTDSEVSLYVLDIIHHRYLQLADKKDQAEDSNYISFMMTLLTGVTSERLAAVGEENDFSSYSLYGIYWSVTKEKWDKHLSVVQHVTNQMNHLPHQKELASLTEYFWSKLLECHNVISILTVYGILTTSNQFMSHDQTDQWQNIIVKLCLSLVYDLTSQEEMSDNLSIEDKSVLLTCCSNCLLIGNETFSMFLQKAVNLLTSLSSEDDISLLTNAITKLLQHECVQNCEKTTTTKQKLQEFKETVEGKVLSLAEKQWWSDFMYQLALM